MNKLELKREVEEKNRNRWTKYINHIQILKKQKQNNKRLS